MMSESEIGHTIKMDSDDYCDKMPRDSTDCFEFFDEIFL